MNKAEVILIVKKTWAEFSRVRAVLNPPEFVKGYNMAISDMVKNIYESSIAPDFEAEREAMLEHIKFLTTENEMLKVECGEQHQTIEILMNHVDLRDMVSGIKKSKREEHQRAKRRGVFFFG